MIKIDRWTPDPSFRVFFFGLWVGVNFKTGSWFVIGNRPLPFFQIGNLNR